MTCNSHEYRLRVRLQLKHPYIVTVDELIFLSFGEILLAQEILIAFDVITGIILMLLRDAVSHAVTHVFHLVKGALLPALRIVAFADTVDVSAK